MLCMLKALVCILVLAVCSAVAWETEAEAASQLRHLLSDSRQHYNQGVLSTLFPSTYHDSTYKNSPLSSPEYFAPCSSNGDLTFLALTVSQNWRNALEKDANATFVVQSNPNPAVPDWRHLSHANTNQWDPHRPYWRKGMPSKMRANLFGFVEEIKGQEEKQLSECFLNTHPDARKWAPGAKESPHHALWVKFVVQRVYATGGFGDEHRIGTIARDVYASAKSRVQDRPKQHSMVQDPPVDDLFADNSHRKGRSGHNTTAALHHPAASAAQQQPFV